MKYTTYSKKEMSPGPFPSCYSMVGFASGKWSRKEKHGIHWNYLPLLLSLTVPLLFFYMVGMTFPPLSVVFLTRVVFIFPFDEHCLLTQFAYVGIRITWACPFVLPRLP